MARRRGSRLALLATEVPTRHSVVGVMHAHLLVASQLANPLLKAAHVSSQPLQELAICTVASTAASQGGADCRAQRTYGRFCCCQARSLHTRMHTEWCADDLQGWLVNDRSTRHCHCSWTTMWLTIASSREGSQ